MKTLIKPTVMLLVLLALCAVAWIFIRSNLQFHAVYPGGLTFIGGAQGLLGTEYHRLHFWRAPGDLSPLPNWTVHVKGTPYPLSDMNEALMKSLGGTTPEGGLKDGEDYYFQYRFEHGRLMFMSVYPSHPAQMPTPEKGKADRFYIQSDAGPPFLLPLTHKQLLQNAGPPLRMSRRIPN
ncbi:MAG: hypothetical protein HYV27_00375 [Candidatus Hydrogenedentes bacterium]|nr:hypothetical protein [Candidatus Hydrogenedentota bacterium]